MPVPLPKQAELKYQGPLLQVYQYTQTLYDGSTAIFESAVRPDVVSVIAFLDPETVLITRQEQPNKPEAFWALPGGRVDPGETQETAVARELLEETGYTATTFVRWYTKTWRGITQFEECLYIAQGLSSTGQGLHLDAGERIEVVQLPWNELVRLSLTHELRGPTLANCVLAMEFDPVSKARKNEFLHNL